MPPGDEGANVGDTVGAPVGSGVGTLVGAGVGIGVGAGVGNTYPVVETELPLCFPPRVNFH